MKFNTDSSFVGIEKLKEIHNAQVSEFEKWALRDEWLKFHYSHYDWWVFPIDRPSSYGLKWVVYEGEISELKKDGLFVNKYLKGIELVSASWGWDVLSKSYISDPKTGQGWYNWPVRLYKAALSAKLFSYEDFFVSLKIFALDLIKQGKSMTYNRRNFGWLFTTGIDPYEK